MSMKGNQHYTNAEHTWRSGEQRAMQATLALAYEQRTANLIALWSNPQCAVENIRGNAVTWSINDDTIGRILEEVVARLGLEDSRTSVKDKIDATQGDE